MCALHSAAYDAPKTQCDVHVPLDLITKQKVDANKHTRSLIHARSRPVGERTWHTPSSMDGATGTHTVSTLATPHSPHRKLTFRVQLHGTRTGKLHRLDCKQRARMPSEWRGSNGRLVAPHALHEPPPSLSTLFPVVRTYTRAWARQRAAAADVCTFAHVVLM